MLKKSVSLENLAMQRLNSYAHALVHYHFQNLIRGTIRFEIVETTAK